MGMWVDSASYTEDVQEWLSYHGKKEGNGVWLDVPCDKLKDGRCLIYDNRPTICKEFKVGGKNCAMAIRRLAELRSE